MTRHNEKPKAAAGLTPKVIAACIVVSLAMWFAAAIWAWCMFTQGC